SIAFADETATVASFVHENRQYKMSSIPNTQWVAIASMDTTEIAATGRDSLMFLAITILLLASVTGALILWLARQLSRPLGSLADQAQLVAAGDFNVAVTPQGTKETRALTRSFNQLVVQVKDLLTQQETETQKAQLFATITGATAISLKDFGQILAKVLPEAQKILQVDRMLFYPVNSEHLAAEAVTSGMLSGLEQAMLTDCIPETLLNARPNCFPLAVADVAAAELNPQHRDYLQALDVHSTLTMPVFTEDVLFGFFVAHDQSPRQWHPSEQTFIAQLAGQFTLVVDRVTALKKIQESRQVAAVLTGEKQQQSIELNQHKEQLAQQSEVLLSQNEELRRQQSELSQQSAEQRRQKEQLQHQIALLVEDIQGISQGDLTVRARVAEGELKTIADVFNLTVARLQALVSQVKQSSTQVSAILTQNEGTAMQLTRATHHQAQEAAKTLGTVQNMIASMGAIAENAQMAAVTAKTVASTAEASEAGMNRTAERILRLHEVCTHAIDQLENLGNSTHPTEPVTATIREIAVAASLLLDQAKAERISFADNSQFAAMIQQLSQLTQRALSETQEAETFLQTLQQKTVYVAGDIKRVSNQVAEGTQLVTHSKCDLEEVAVVARRFDHLAQSIAKATFSQSQISQAVSTLVKEVAELSEQTATFAQKMEGALHETVDMAQGLQESVSLFKVENVSFVGTDIL
ncbi:MAG: HAMP domain-containing protein, partial [Cyanobacteria bacterium J06636_16]